MEIKMTLNEALNINHILGSIIDGSENDADALLKFRLLGIMKSLEPHISNFEAVRNETIARFGKKTEDGKIQISADDTEAVESFNRELSKVINSEISVCIDKLKPEEIFGKGVSSEYLIGLYNIIEA